MRQQWAYLRSKCSLETDLGPRTTKAEAELDWDACCSLVFLSKPCCYHLIRLARHGKGDQGQVHRPLPAVCLPLFIRHSGRLRANRDALY